MNTKQFILLILLTVVCLIAYQFIIRGTVHWLGWLGLFMAAVNVVTVFIAEGRK